MKLLKLEILNLASLDKKEGEVINFDEGALGESSIFSIVGPTGSGKSTILDAICLALYNRAPRYPKKKGDRNQGIEIYGQPDADEKKRLAPTDGRNILTHGKKLGYSKLTFRANDGCVYRAEWSVQFKLKNYDNVITKLYRITVANGTLHENEADWNQLPQIIGLDFERFLRTVLIAQGSFANFINAKEEERYELLEKLIGSEETYVRIAREIKKKKDDATEAYKTMSISLAAVEQNRLDDEQLERLKAEIETLEAAEKQFADALQRTKDSLQWYADDEAKAGAVKEYETKLAEAKKALDEIKANVERLDLHDALAQAVDLLREAKRLEAEIAGLEAKIANNQGTVKQLEEKRAYEQALLTQLEKKYEETKALIETTTPHIKAARELLTKMEAAKTTLVERQQAQSVAAKEWQAAQKAVTDNETQITKAQAEVAGANKALDDLKKQVDRRREELRSAAEKAGKTLEDKKKEVEGKDAETLQNHKSRSDKALTDLEKSVDVLSRLDRARRDKSAKKARLAMLEERNKAIDEALSPINVEVLDEEVKTLRKTHTLMVSEQWGLHRSLLAEGKPCPLCGAIEHPYSHDAALFEETESELGAMLRKKEQELKEQTDKVANLTKEKEGNNREMESISESIRALEDEMADLERQLKEVRDLHPQFPLTQGELESLKPAFEKRCREAEAALKTYNTVQVAITKLTKAKETAEEAFSDYEQTSHSQIDKAKDALAAAETQLAAAKAQTPNLVEQQDIKKTASDKANDDLGKAMESLSGLEKQYRAELNGEHPDMVETRLNKSKEEGEQAVNKKKEELAKLEGELRETKGTIASLENQREQDQTHLEEKKAGLQRWMEAYNAKDDRIKTIDRTDIEAVMAVPNGQWEADRQEKKVRNDAVVSATSLLESAKKTHEQHQQNKPEKSRDDLLGELNELQGRGPNEALINARTKLKNHNDAVQKLGSSAAELDRLTRLKDDWTDITAAIGTDGKTLRKIAQCYTLSFLIEHANAEIRKFNSRYELIQVKNSLGIRVVDHDRADDVRDTTSLSGGETFIVSLGLALGLSSLSSSNNSCENLFIDEGFGTLDPDTLAIVIDSLAMLQSNQGKKVGVISHTDAMTSNEHITTQIRIVKNGNSGSSHIEFYP